MSSCLFIKWLLLVALYSFAKLYGKDTYGVILQGKDKTSWKVVGMWTGESTSVWTFNRQSCFLWWLCSSSRLKFLKCNVPFNFKAKDKVIHLNRRWWAIPLEFAFRHILRTFWRFLMSLVALELCVVWILKDFHYWSGSCPKIIQFPAIIFSAIFHWFIKQNIHLQLSWDNRTMKSYSKLQSLIFPFPLVLSACCPSWTFHPL